MDRVGAGIHRKEALDKVTGGVKYVGDLITPGMLHARLVTSAYAHAKIQLIDTAEALKSPGVKAVLTGQDFPILTGAYLEDRPMIAREKVRYYGEPVAVVIANTELEAKTAAEKIRVDYLLSPVVNSPGEAVKPTSPLVHENLGQYRRVRPVFPEPNTNISNRTKIRKGDMGKAWAISDVIIEASFSLPKSDHIALETRAVRAEIKADGRVIIDATSQAPFIIRRLISRYFKVDTGKITVNVPLVGGAFGGKAAVQLELIAYVASLAVHGKPVQLVNTREQDMISSPCRIGLDAKIKFGATKDGKLQAAEIIYLVDGGAYSDISAVMSKSMGTDCTGPYKIDNVSCDSICVYTNHPYAISYTGFGHESYTYAIERTMDMLARKLNMDPLELRLKNAIAAGDTTPSLVGLTLSNIGRVDQCLQRVKELIHWEEGQRLVLPNGRIRAKGISAFWKTSSTPPNARSGAVLTFNPDGSLNVSVGSVEMGQGSKTGLAQIVAERLKMDIDKVHVLMDVNTHVNPEHFKTVASMTIFMVGRALIRAADDVAKQLRISAAIVLRCSPEDLEVGEGRVFLKDNSNLYIDIVELVHGYMYQNGNSIGGQIIGQGSYIVRHLSDIDPETGKGNTGPGWTVGAEAVEVELDPKDYSYKLLKAAAVLDPGKVINPVLATSVVMGRMAMGLSLASRESFIYDEQGIIQNADLRSYHILRYGEHPEYVVDFVETPQIDGPFGARGLAEHGLVGMPGALGNALSLAVQSELNQLPLTPEIIWRTVKEAKA